MSRKLQHMRPEAIIHIEIGVEHALVERDALDAHKRHSDEQNEILVAAMDYAFF